MVSKAKCIFIKMEDMDLVSSIKLPTTDGWKVAEIG
jgi:hypothetical protein